MQRMRVREQWAHTESHTCAVSEMLSERLKQLDIGRKDKLGRTDNGRVVLSGAVSVKGSN